MLNHQAPQLEDWDSDSNIMAEQLCHLRVSSSESNRRRFFIFFLSLLVCKFADVVVYSVLTTLYKFYFFPHITFRPCFDSLLSGYHSQELWFVGVAAFKLSLKYSRGVLKPR